MAIVDIALFWFVFICAALAAWIEYRQRSGWPPILLLIVIALAFAAHLLMSTL